MTNSQLVSESEIDTLLVGNPQITYFKSVYRRHTQFHKGIHTYENKTYVLNDNIGSHTESFSYGTYDLISNIFLENKITGLTSTDIIYANLGNNIIDNISFNVGSTLLCKVEGLYMEARGELDNPYVPNINESATVPPIMTYADDIKCNTGSQYNVQTMAGGVTGGTHTANYDTDTFYTYPNFYFCREYGNAFPICALNNSEVTLIIEYRDKSKFIETTIGQLETSVNVEYINISDDERRRFINNTEIYIYYDIETIFNGSSGINEPNGKNYPIRQFFFIGKNLSPSTVVISPSTPVSLSGLISGLTIKVNSQSLYEDTNLAIFTKQNLNRLYPGYGRKLGYNRIKLTIAALAGLQVAGLAVSQTGITGILAEDAAAGTSITIYVIVTSTTPFASGGGGVTTVGTEPSLSVTAIAYEPLGYTDSIGVHSFCLDTTNTPSGHLSANTNFSIDFTGGTTNNIQIYLEAIKFFRIQGGQLGLLYV